MCIYSKSININTLCCRYIVGIKLNPPDGKADHCVTFELSDNDTHLCLQIRIRKLNESARKTSIFNEPNVVKYLSHLHDKYVVVPAEKAPNNIFVVCKLHYIDCLIKESGIDNLPGIRTYSPTTLPKAEVLCNHMSVLCAFGNSTKDEEVDLLSLPSISK
jgi:hypothetical protein